MGAVDPGNKEHVLGPGLDGAGPRKEHLRKGVVDNAYTEFIASILLAEHLDNLHHPSSFFLFEINPAYSPVHKQFQQILH